jgi:hypothetical protein
MSRIMQSTVAGIVLTLTLGATAAHARPQSRADTRRAGPIGIAESAWSWWNGLLEKAVPSGRGGLSAIWGKAGSQMDPNGSVVTDLVARPPAPLTGSR